MRKITFVYEDIVNKEGLEKEISKEAQAIFEGESTNRGRSLLQINSQVRQGKIAEYFLSEKFGYQLANNKYHDLVDMRDGAYVEVKAYSGIDSLQNRYVQAEVNRIKGSTWNKSKEMIVFSVSEEEVYTLLGVIPLKMTREDLHEAYKKGREDEKRKILSLVHEWSNQEPRDATVEKLVEEIRNES